MDQMTSACGEANKLLAMICQVMCSSCCLIDSMYALMVCRRKSMLTSSSQPAEVLGLVEIPSHIRFWGIDSGIKHRYKDSSY